MNAPASDSIGFTGVIAAPDMGAAQLLAEALADEGIPVRLRRRDASSYLGPFSLVRFEQIEVLVPPQQLEAARAVLASLEQAEVQPDLEDLADPEDPDDLDGASSARSPQNEADSGAVLRHRRPAAALLLMVLVPLPVSCLYARSRRLAFLLLGLFVWSLCLFLLTPLRSTAAALLLSLKLTDGLLATLVLRMGSWRARRGMVARVAVPSREAHLKDPAGGHR